MRNAAPKLLRAGMALYFCGGERYGIDSFAKSVLLCNHIIHSSAYKTCRSKLSQTSVASPPVQAGGVPDLLADLCKEKAAKNSCNPKP